jgi:hypothetical protein
MVRKHLRRGSAHASFVKILAVAAVIVASAVAAPAAGATTRLQTQTVIATPTNVTGYPSNASAIVTWSFSQSTPVDSFEVVCTATGNPENTVTVFVPGTQTNATVGGLTNGTEYTCVVRAHVGGGTGPFSAPSPPFTPSDGSNSKFIDPSIGGKVNLTPVQSFVGTTGQLVLPAQPSTAPAVAATSSNSVVVSASLFGSPGQVDPSCGGNTCVGQGINWTISNLSAFAMVKVVFNEDPSITNGGKVNKANVYLNDVLLPACSKTLKINCVGDRDTTTNGGWKVTIKVDGHLDPHGRL